MRRNMGLRYFHMDQSAMPRLAFSQENISIGDGAITTNKIYLKSKL